MKRTYHTHTHIQHTYSTHTYVQAYKDRKVYVRTQQEAGTQDILENTRTL